MDNEVIAMALRMIGKNIMLIADAIYKEPEPAEVDEKPKKKARKTSKAKAEDAALNNETEPTETHEAEPVPEEEKPKKLSQIKKEDYAEFLKEVEMIGYE